MDFDLNEEQKIFRDAVAAFGEKELAAGAVARAHEESYPWDVAEKAAGQGLLGITIPESAGGQGGSLMDAVIAIQTIAMHCPRSADVVQAGNFGAIRVLAEYGTDDQKARYLAPLLAGKGIISVCMTEPDAGSAATDLRTAAKPDGDGFRINGTKIFTTNGTDATVFLVYVRYGPGVGGIGAMLVTRDNPGLVTGRRTRFMSGEDWQPLIFEDAYVPKEDVLLGPGGFKKLIAGFNVERIGNTSRALALGRYAFETAREHALTREQFGRQLCEFQGLQWKFADMRMRLDAAQLLLYRAATNADNGFPSAEETAIAKAYCNETGFFVANEALQVMGGAGYSQDSLVEYCLRRTRGWMIAGGSLEMMRNRIAEGVFGRSFSQRPPKPTDG